MPDSPLTEIQMTEALHQRRLMLLSQTYQAMLAGAVEDETTTWQLIEDLRRTLKQSKRIIDARYTDEAQVQAIREYVQYHQDHPGYDGVLLGIPAVDNMLLGVPPKSMVALVARPGVGKTSICQQWARNIALQTPTLYFSNEATIELLLRRDVASLSGISSRRMRTGDKFSDTDWKSFNAALYEIGVRDMFYYVMPSPVADDILDAVHDMNEIMIARGRTGARVGCVVLDYIQQMSGQDDWKTLGEHMKRLEEITLREKIVTIVAAQAKRDFDGGEEMGSTKGFSKIEDLVHFMFLLTRLNHRHRVSLLNCVKHREEGATFKLPLWNHPETGDSISAYDAPIDMAQIGLDTSDFLNPYEGLEEL